METIVCSKGPSIIKVVEADVNTKKTSGKNETSYNEMDIATNTFPKELPNLSSTLISVKEPSIVREANITSKETSYINILLNTNEQCNIREANRSIKEMLDIEGQFNTKVEFFYDRKEVATNSTVEPSFYVRETNITKEPLSRKEVFRNKKEIQASTIINEQSSIREAYNRNEFLETKDGNSNTEYSSDIKSEFLSFKEAYDLKEANKAKELSKMSSNDSIKELYNKETSTGIDKKCSNIQLRNNAIDMDNSKMESSKLSFMTSKETFKTKDVSLTTKEPPVDPADIPKEPFNARESHISTKEPLKVSTYNTLKEYCKLKDNTTTKEQVGTLASSNLKDSYMAQKISISSKGQFEVEMCTMPKEPCISSILTTKKRLSEIPTFTILKESYKTKEVNIKDPISTLINTQKTFNTREAHITKKGSPEVPVFSVSEEPCKTLDSTLSKELYHERFTCVIKKEPIEMSSCTLTSKESYNAGITKKEPLELSCSSTAQELHNVKEPIVTKKEPCDYNETPSESSKDISSNANVSNICSNKELEVTTINLPDGDIKVFQVAPCPSNREEILDSVGKEICTILPTFPGNKQSLWADVISSIDARRNPEHFNSEENRSWSSVHTPNTEDIHIGLAIHQHQGMYPALAPPYENSSLPLSQTCDNDYLKSVKNKAKNRTRMKQYRTNPLFREKEKEKDKLRIRQKRTDASYREIEKEKDRVRRRSVRQQKRRLEKEQQFRQILQALNMQAALFENYGSQSYLTEAEHNTGLTDQPLYPANMITNVSSECTEQGISGNVDAPVATIDLPDGNVKVFQITPQLMVEDQVSNGETSDGGITAEKNLLLPTSFQNQQSFETAKKWMEILSTMSSVDVMSFMSSLDMRKEVEKFISTNLWSNIAKFGGVDRRWNDLNLCEAQEALVALMPEDDVITYDKDTIAEAEARREKDRIRKRMARQDPLYSEQNELRKEKAKARMRERRLNPTYREAEKERDRLRRKLSRHLNTEQRQLERERDKLRRKLSRQLNTEQRQLERERDRVRRRLARQSNPELRRLESERAKERRKLKLLLNPELRQVERERNTQYKRFSRSINTKLPAEEIEVTPMLNFDGINTKELAEELEVTPMLHLDPNINIKEPAEEIEVTPMLNLDCSINTQVPIEELQC